MEGPGIRTKYSVADPGCLSRIPLFSIPDPNCLHPGSRIRIKEFKYFNPKKWFLSSRKYDPGCSSRIPDPDADFYPSRIPDPGVKKAPDPGSGFATLTKYYGSGRPNNSRGRPFKTLASSSKLPSAQTSFLLLYLETSVTRNA